jgi:cytochrome P450
MLLTTRWTKQYGGAYRFGSFFGQPRLYISDAAALNHIFKFPYKYPKQEATRQRISRVLGKGLVWVEGEDHRRQRRVMSHAFIRARIRDQFAVFKNVTSRLRAAVDRDIPKGSEVGVVNVNDIMSRATMDIILEAALDHPCNTLEHGTLEIVEIYRGFMLAVHGGQSDIFKVINEYTARLPAFLNSCITRMPTARYRDMRHRMGVTAAFANKIVNEKIKQVQEGAVISNDSLGLMIKANMNETGKAKLSKEEIVEQVSTLIQAGHDTTAATLSWLLDVLAEKQEWQDKLREAVVDFLETNPEPDMEDYEGFTLLNAVIKEGMRYRVTVPYVTRVAAEDDIIPLSKPIIGRDGKPIKEIFVPKGTPVDGGLGDYNQSPDIWGPDAGDFNPERWLDRKGPLKTDQVADGTWGGGLITFITGPRTCLGFRVAVLEMQMFLTELLASFKFERRDDEPVFYRPHAPVVQPVCEGKVQMPLKVTRLERS